MSRRRIEGRLTELSSDDLRFRSWEVERLFKDVYREPLSPEEVAEVTTRTDGWPAVLQLFHLATSGRTAARRRETLGALSTRSRLVREYLTRNILEQLPGELRRFLLDTCVLPRLSGPLCDAFLGRTGSEKLLDQVERRQLLLVSLDDGSFRYHEVLRSYLESVLVTDVGEAETSARYRRAGRMLEDAAAYTDAIRAYSRAEDHQAISRLLGSQGEAVVAAPGTWVEKLSERRGRDRPVAAAGPRPAPPRLRTGRRRPVGLPAGRGGLRHGGRHRHRPAGAHGPRRVDHRRRPPADGLAGARAGGDPPRPAGRVGPGPGRRRRARRPRRRPRRAPGRARPRRRTAPRAGRRHRRAVAPPGGGGLLRRRRGPGPGRRPAGGAAGVGPGGVRGAGPAVAGAAVPGRPRDRAARRRAGLVGGAGRRVGTGPRRRRPGGSRRAGGGHGRRAGHRGLRLPLHGGARAGGVGGLVPVAGRGDRGRRRRPRPRPGRRAPGPHHRHPGGGRRRLPGAGRSPTLPSGPTTPPSPPPSPRSAACDRWPVPGAGGPGRPDRW